MIHSLRISFFILLFLLTGCVGVDIEDYADSEPRLDICRVLYRDYASLGHGAGLFW